jgi:hypothetical protein
MSFSWPRIEGVVESLTKSNALYPLLICLLFTVLFSISIFSLTENIYLQFFAVILVGMPLFQIIRSYQYFSTKNPDLLRTETHIFKKRVLEILGDDQHPISEGAVALLSATINQTNPIRTTDKVDPGSIEIQQPQEKDHE